MASPPAPTTKIELATDDNKRLLYMEWINIGQGLATLVSALQGQAFAVYYLNMYGSDVASVVGTAAVNIAITDGTAAQLAILLSSVFDSTTQQILPAEFGSIDNRYGIVVPGGRQLVIQNKYGGSGLGIRTMVLYQPVTYRI